MSPDIIESVFRCIEIYLLESTQKSNFSPHFSPSGLVMDFSCSMLRTGIYSSFFFVGKLVPKCNRVFAAISNFLISFSLQPDDVNLRLFEQTELII